jgi:HlyD family secretion protein
MGPRPRDRDGEQASMTKSVHWRVIGVAAAIIVLAVGGGGYWLTHRASAERYVTAPVTRGDVTTTITASGSVNPVVTVQVGSYVSGPIQALSCDYNTRVSKGQLCAKIDPRSYQIIVAEDQAGLRTAQSQLIKDQAGLVYARLAHQRAALLFSQDSGSHDAADLARSAYDQALALVGLDHAQVAQKAAALKAALINLDYTNIVSPVDGTVVSRNVNVGQTVAASFQTPTLFLIATDLTRMQVDTNVSESDIGGAAEGRGASFTVDTFPDQTFIGQVSQVRQAPISVQNVITYDVVVTVANPELKLKPGMTATAKIVRDQARGVLRVPSQALRFIPAGGDAPRAGRAGRGGQGAHRAVWVQRDGKLTRVPVTVGLDDDSFAEIKAGDLKPGDQVVVSEATAPKASKSVRPAAAATPSLRL